jgi:hypothetical protein
MKAVKKETGKTRIKGSKVTRECYRGDGEFTEIQNGNPRYEVVSEEKHWDKVIGYIYRLK